MTSLSLFLSLSLCLHYLSLSLHLHFLISLSGSTSPFLPPFLPSPISPYLSFPYSLPCSPLSPLLPPLPPLPPSSFSSPTLPLYPPFLHSSHYQSWYHQSGWSWFHSPGKRWKLQRYSVSHFACKTAAPITWKRKMLMPTTIIATKTLLPWNKASMKIDFICTCTSAFAKL